MADHGRLYAVNEEMRNSLITDAKAYGDDDECDQTHLSPVRFSPSWLFAASLILINDEYTYGHDKKQQTGPVVVGFDSDRFIKYCDRASPDYDSKLTDFNGLPENWLRQEKYGLVVTCLSKPEATFRVQWIYNVNVQQVRRK